MASSVVATIAASVIPVVSEETLVLPIQGSVDYYEQFELEGETEVEDCHYATTFLKEVQTMELSRLQQKQHEEMRRLQYRHAAEQKLLHASPTAPLFGVAEDLGVLPPIPSAVRAKRDPSPDFLPPSHLERLGEPAGEAYSLFGPMGIERPSRQYGRSSNGSSRQYGHSSDGPSRQYGHLSNGPSRQYGHSSDVQFHQAAPSRQYGHSTDVAVAATGKRSKNVATVRPFSQQKTTETARREIPPRFRKTSSRSSGRSNSSCDGSLSSLSSSRSRRSGPSPSTSASANLTRSSKMEKMCQATTSKPQRQVHVSNKEFVVATGKGGVKLKDRMSDLDQISLDDGLLTSYPELEQKGQSRSELTKKDSTPTPHAQKSRAQSPSSNPKRPKSHSRSTRACQHPPPGKKKHVELKSEKRSAAKRQRECSASIEALATEIENCNLEKKKENSGKTWAGMCLIS